MLILYSRRQEAFIITNGQTTYMLSNNGLSQLGYCPTSIVSWFDIGNTPGTSLPGTEHEMAIYQSLSDGEFRLATEVLDFNNRRVKTLAALEVGVDSPAAIQAAIAYRYGFTKTMSTSRWKYLNKEGQVAPIVSGLEFQIKLRSSSYIDVNIDELRAKYQLVDKRITMGAQYGTKNAKGTTDEGE
jgi:hypothetical protein